MDIFFLFPNTIVEDYNFNPFKSIIIIQDEYFFDKLPYHKLKLIFHRSSLRYYFDFLQQKYKSKEIIYVENRNDLFKLNIFKKNANISIGLWIT